MKPDINNLLLFIHTFVIFSNTGFNAVDGERGVMYNRGRTKKRQLERRFT